MPVSTALKARRVTIGSVDFHPENARNHDLDTIKDSLTAHGQYVPIVVQESTGFVLKGNGTLEAARDLGWTHVSAVLIAVDDDEARRILLVDNRASDQGTYDEDALTNLLAGLGGDFTGTGYDEGDLDARLAMLDPEPTDGGAASEERDRWAERDVRTIQLSYTVADHAQNVGKLDLLADQMGLDNYSEVVAHLLADATR